MLYLENGYANMDYIIRRGMTFSFVIGGRGTGKTYGVLKYIVQTGTKFILMRKTQAQLDTIARTETNPFKSVVRDLQLPYSIEPQSAGTNIYTYHKTETDEDGKPIYGETVGYAVALSTIANLRGFDMSDAELIVFDEFISESHERKLRNESDAFSNAYETINRNRELQGKRPVQVVALANANDFACPLLIGFNLVSTVERMLKQGKSEYVNPQRSVGIFLLTDSPISSRKSSTALYRLTTGSEFFDMAINNAFAGADDPDVRAVSLSDFSPYVVVGELCVYRHKSESRYYVSTHKSGSVAEYSGTGLDMKRFFAVNRQIMFAAMNGRITYETHLCKALFLRYCGFL